MTVVLFVPQAPTASVGAGGSNTYGGTIFGAYPGYVTAYEPPVDAGLSWVDFPVGGVVLAVFPGVGASLTSDTSGVLDSQTIVSGSVNVQAIPSGSSIDLSAIPTGIVVQED